MKPTPRISIDRPREVFDYDKDSGQFTRKIHTGGRGVVGPANQFKFGHGYAGLSVDNCRLMAHRVAWAIVTGEWPNHDIDHIDGNRRNNKWANLREATRSENMQNQRGARRDSSTGLMGVKRVNNKFRAQITVDHQYHHLGYFSTPQEAHEAYLVAKRELHPFNTLRAN